MIRQELKVDTITTSLQRAAEALGDLTALNQDMGEFMLESTERNFREGTSPDGTPWAPKSMATMEAYRRREAKGLNGPVPARPLIGPSKALSTTIAYEADATGLSWGSNMIYAAVMQLGASKGQFGTTSRGSPIPWGTIPPRPFLGIGPEDELGLLAIIEEYMTGLLDD